jgi:hypothetical protein
MEPQGEEALKDDLGTGVRSLAEKGPDFILELTFRSSLDVFCIFEKNDELLRKMDINGINSKI